MIIVFRFSNQDGIQTLNTGSAILYMDYNKAQVYSYNVKSDTDNKTTQKYEYSIRLQNCA